MKTKDIQAALSGSVHVKEHETEQLKQKLEKQGFFERHFACFCSELFGSLVIAPRADKDEWKM